jgi:hypothetical protein
MPQIAVDSAVVPAVKLVDYLLSTTHPVGSHKAVFFRALGYSRESCDVLARDLVALLRSNATALELTEYGQKIASRGLLHGPNGRRGYVFAVWIILNGDSAPSFVTAYPGVLHHV